MRIILADHHEGPRSALETLFEEQPDFHLVGEAMDAQSLLGLVKNRCTDLVLVDDELPGMRIEELLRKIRAYKATLIIIVMSVRVENSRQLLNSGANVFVSKGDRPDWLLEILKKFANQIKMKEAKDQIT